MPEPKRYRKKAIEVEAVQWTGENREEVEAFAGGRSLVINEDEIRLWCGTAVVGDYIYRDEGGSNRCCPASAFEARHEPVGAPAPLQKDGGEGLTIGEKIAAFKALTTYAEAFPLPDIDSVLKKLVRQISPDPAQFDAVFARLEREHLAASTQPASPSEEKSADDPLANLRPASRAHLALTAAVLQCIETGVEPDTIRRFVNEELPASPSPVEGDDWPEVWLQRYPEKGKAPHERRLRIATTRPAPGFEKSDERRRYVPATSDKEAGEVEGADDGSVRVGPMLGDSEAEDR